MKKASAWMMVLLCASSVSAPLSMYAETVMTIDDVIAYAAEYNRDIKAAIRSVEDSLESLKEVFTLDDSSISLDSGYTYTAATSTTDASHGFTLVSSLSVPIVPQLSLSAGISKDLLSDTSASGTAQITFSPFAGKTTEWKDWETYRKAEIHLTQTQIGVPLGAEVAALDVIRGQMGLSYALESLELEEQKYDIAGKRYELADMTYTELQDAGSDLSTARQSYYDAQKSLLSLKKAIYQIIGPDLGDITVHEVTAEELVAMIETRDRELKLAQDGAATTGTLLNRAVELESLNRQLKKTPVYKPDISISASITYTTVKAGGSLSFSLSPNQFQTEERADILADIADKESDLRLEQANLDLELRMLGQNISVAREALQVSLNDYANAQSLVEETQVLLDQGQRTTVELRESELALFTSQIQLFTAAAELYENLGDLLLLYRLS